MANAILILCPDFVTERMAGPAIRYWEFAKTLATTQPVTLATPNEPPPTLQQLTSARLLQHTPDNIDELIHTHDIILFQGYIFDIYPQLRHSSKVLVADLYDPIPLEGLERHKDQHWTEAMPHITQQVRTMNTQLKLADYFLCASDRQRDLWLGHLLALGRINPLTFQQTQQRVLTVPFGLPDTPPRRTGPGFRQTLATEDGLVLLWGGGIWEWFDPLTVIRAVHRLLPDYPHIKLVFLGTRHPNPTIPVMPMQHRAETLAQELGLYGTHVIFQSGWVAYDTLQNHLLDADVGVSAHLQSLETHFSFRTRLLYYLWAGKPIITTRGDVLADAVAEAHAGIVVDYADEAAWVEAIAQLHDRQRYATFVEGVKILATKYVWSKVTRSLQALCAQATLAADMSIDNGLRRSLVWDCEHEYTMLRQQLDIVEHSNSWRMTAPLRDFRRWLTSKVGVK